MTLLCRELQVLLEAELHHGNHVVQGPYVADWPSVDSVFASLREPFRVARAILPGTVTCSTNDDIHFGWVEACECTLHHHVLVAGQL